MAPIEQSYVNKHVVVARDTATFIVQGNIELKKGSKASIQFAKRDTKQPGWRRKDDNFTTMCFSVFCRLLSAITTPIVNRENLDQ